MRSKKLVFLLTTPACVGAGGCGAAGAVSAVSGGDRIDWTGASPVGLSIVETTIMAHSVAAMTTADIILFLVTSFTPALSNPV
jgi:hypothetical protein